MENVIELITELSGQGMSDKDVSAYIYDELGVVVANDTVRYHARRKGKKEENRKKMEAEGISKTLVLTDLHIPFHREDTIIDIIMKHRNEIDTIIFGGDIVDCEGISSFPKEIRKPMIEEMEVAYKFLKRVDRLTPDVEKIMIWGNHEYRYVRYLENKGNELNPFHSGNILEEIVKGFTRYDRGRNKKTVYPPLSGNFKVVDKWFVQHGDMIVAHPKNFSKINLRTAVSTVDHFLARGMKFNTCGIGHTHKQGTTMRNGIWTIEFGCLCKPMDYADTGNIGYTPQNYGYALVTQVEGVTDINQSRAYILDLVDEVEGWEEEIHE